MNKSDEILLELYQKVSDGNLFFGVECISAIVLMKFMDSCTLTIPKEARLLNKNYQIKYK